MRNCPDITLLRVLKKLKTKKKVWKKIGIGLKFFQIKKKFKKLEEKVGKMMEKKLEKKLGKNWKKVETKLEKI